MKQICTQLPNAIRGITLVVIMIALVLSLLLSAGAIQVFVSNKATHQTAEALSRIQENGRFAIEFLTKEIRMAGFVGCNITDPDPAKSNKIIANAITPITPSADNWKYDSDNSMFGYTGGVDTFPTNIHSGKLTGSDTDAIVISRGEETGYLVSSHASPNITLARSHSFEEGEILMIVDCLKKQAGIFRQSSDTTGTQIVTHADGASMTPNNCTEDLGGTAKCPTSSSPPFSSLTYDNNAKILRIKNSIFYIATERKNSQGAYIPALYRSSVLDNGEDVIDEELVEGIERFKILYGIDTDNNGIANRYDTADEVNLLIDGWSKVASVRLFLVARSIEKTGGNIKPFTFMGVTTNDPYSRRQFTVTIQVRNHRPDLGL